jgi:hypothetical protein
MASITLPQVTTHADAHAVPERRAHSHGQPPRERFAPLWLRTSLILATLATLALLYPRSYIETSLRRSPRPDAATLAYLRLMVLTQPAAADTRILLARQALTAGDLSLSRYALAPWRDRGFAGLALDIAVLKLRLLRAELYAQPSASSRHAQLAAAYTRGVLLLAPRMDGSELLRQAHFLAVLGEYPTAARLYRHLIAQTGDAALRRKAFLAGIEALRAAGRPLDALAFAQDELSNIPPSTGLWRLMTRLALLADAPKEAARYARRLMGFEGP